VSFVGPITSRNCMVDAIIDRHLPFEYVISSRSTDEMMVCQLDPSLKEMNC
jgi:hypothetical protein